ncbi:GNAT family N-acetyltransferase [Microvirga rosea]|uniref:GNAT family N-acetyltransferase n=1 Tax=Microvirga rosea TaxID=2715425 RepID=UPI001D0B6570|nr:N-acetyltransferase [Microvirga rosea]MCB8822355.1 GNAT family N-acetyltransferase [Microvirga rosea]
MAAFSKTDVTARVQEACLNGWPALREVALDGWLLRFSQGYTRRVNSVNILAPGERPLDEKIRYCEALYADQGLPTIFCVPTTGLIQLDQILDQRGYAPPEDETRVLHVSLEQGEPVRSEDVALDEGRPSEDWLQTLTDLQGRRERERRIHRQILDALAVPAVFASVPVGAGRLGAMAFGAVHDGIVCVNSVATDPEFRRRGLAQKTIAAILAWARDVRGATGACVPVAADNAPAVALYQGLGFRDEIFRYHYRRAG